MTEWKIIDNRPGNEGEIVFESEDPHAVLAESNRLEKEAIDDGPFEGEAHASFAIEGDGDLMGEVAST